MELDKLKNKYFLVILVFLSILLIYYRPVDAEGCIGPACVPGNQCNFGYEDGPYYLATEIYVNWFSQFDACEVDSGCNLGHIDTNRNCNVITNLKCIDPVDWNNCLLSNPLCADICIDAPDGNARCPTPAECNKVTSKGGCSDGATCRVSNDWFFNGKTCKGKWDADQYECVYCSGKIKTKRIGDSTKLYTVDNSNCNLWGQIILPGSVCSSACGADPLCDEIQQGTHCNNGILTNCTNCNFTGRFCSTGCGASRKCSGSLPGDHCNYTTATGEVIDGFCNGNCKCELECKGCWRDCDGNSDDCETNICTNASHCGGCNQRCSTAAPGVNQTLNECINGWCTCNKGDFRYGACQPSSQYSFNPPSCSDGSDWGSCNSQDSPKDGFSLWGKTNGGENRASDLCNGNVEYVAKRDFYYDSFEEEWTPEYTIHICNYNLFPFNDTNFNIEYGVGYIVYPAIPPPGGTGGGFNIDLRPGWNFIGWSLKEENVTIALDSHLLNDVRYDWICEK